MTTLDRYLDRIAYDGSRAPTLETLKALHRAHLRAIPYENLDVQMERPLTPGPRAAVDKVVDRRRGGWCYEMNGTFGWALGELGFDVTRLAGGVGRGGAAGLPGNHLVNLVRLPEPDGLWIADVGLGDGPLDPFPVREHAFTAGGLPFRVEALEGGGWRLHNHPTGAAPYYDFRLDQADEDLLAEVCQRIQTNPESPKRLNALVLRHVPGGFLRLRGRILQEEGEAGVSETLIENADDYVSVLRDRFALDLPEAAAIWPRILARHETLFPVVRP